MQLKLYAEKRLPSSTKMSFNVIRNINIFVKFYYKSFTINLMPIISAPNWYPTAATRSCDLRGTRFKSNLVPVEFYACNKVSPLKNCSPMLRSVPRASITQLKAVRGTCKAPNKKLFYRL